MKETNTKYKDKICNKCDSDLSYHWCKRIRYEGEIYCVDCFKEMKISNPYYVSFSFEDEIIDVILFKTEK